MPKKYKFMSKLMKIKTKDELDELDELLPKNFWSRDYRPASVDSLRGYPQKFAGISLGDQIQDVVIARGNPRAKSQHVGITVFLTCVGGLSLNESRAALEISEINLGEISEIRRDSFEILSRFRPVSPLDFEISFFLTSFSKRRFGFPDSSNAHE